MKRQLLIHAILLTVLMSMMGTKAIAHDIETANADGVTIYYNLINENTELEVTFRGIAYDEYENDYTGIVNIPASVTYNGVTYPVTTIGSCAFINNTGLISVNIAEGVVSLGIAAFYGCTGLTSIHMPKSLTNFIYDQSVFYDCHNLSSIEVAEGNMCFDSRNHCNAIIETATNTLVKGCKSTLIPNDVTSIGGYAFAYSGLTAITIPSAVMSVNSSAFNYCPDLVSIKVEEGNTVYDSRDNCNAIVQKEKNQIVVGCKATTFPNSVTDIASYAFQGSGVTSLYIGGGVKTIDRSAFAYCTELASLTISPNVTSIQRIAFSFCPKLSRIIVEDGNTKYDSRDNCNAIIETASNTLALGCKNTVIPASVIAIGKDAFVGCSEMTTIDIPNQITIINSEAFYECTNLMSVKFPENLQTIGKHAFRSCTSLTSITIPKSVTSILENAFYNCHKLRSVISKIEEPKDILANVFYVNSSLGQLEIYSNATLFVPTGTIEKYRQRTGWKEFLNIVDTDPSGVKNVNQNGDISGKEYFTLDGKRLNQPQHGLNIVRMSNGTTKKVVIKK